MGAQFLELRQQLVHGVIGTIPTVRPDLGTFQLVREHAHALFETLEQFRIDGRNLCCLQPIGEFLYDGIEIRRNGSTFGRTATSHGFRDFGQPPLQCVHEGRINSQPAIALDLIAKHLDVVRQRGDNVSRSDLRGEALERADGMLKLLHLLGCRTLRCNRIGLVRQQLDSMAEFGEFLRRGECLKPVADTGQSVFDVSHRRDCGLGPPVRLQSFSQRPNLCLQGRNRTRGHGVSKRRADCHEVLTPYLDDLFDRRRHFLERAANFSEMLTQGFDDVIAPG